MNNPFNKSPLTGYPRKDGKKGVRNHTIVIYTVECAKFVAHQIAQKTGAQVMGFSGCYDNQYAVNLILSLVKHPNVGAVLAVGLGCEYTKAHEIARIAQEQGKESDHLLIQEEGGTKKSIARGMSLVLAFQKTLSEQQRVPMDPSELIIGSECGGSDSTSAIAANPAMGKSFDLLIEAGGTAIFEEIVELVGLKAEIQRRAANPDVATKIGQAYDKMEAYCKKVKQYSVSPGNFAGGLSSIEEKSLGSYLKSGSKNIQGVIKVSERPTSKGLFLLDSVPDENYMDFGYTNPNDTEGLMDLMSCGAQILLYSTGRGSCTGSVIAPVVKVTGNPLTYQFMQDDMDYNAGKIISNGLTLDEAGIELSELIIDTALGQKTKSEALGHEEYYIMYKHQDAKPEMFRDGCKLTF